MRNAVVAVLAAALVSALVAACSSGDHGSTSKATATTEATATVELADTPTTAPETTEATSPTEPPAATLQPAVQSFEEQLRRDCPSRFRDPCVETMAQILSIPGAPYGRVALCVNERGNWTNAAEIGSPPSESLAASSAVGDPCPGAPEHTIKAIYDPRGS